MHKIKKYSKQSIFIILFFLALHALAQNPSYEDGLPKPSEVLEKIQGDNQLTTLAKQSAAFELLEGDVMLGIFSTKQMQSTKKTIQADYDSKIKSLHKQFLQESNENKWSELIQNYVGDKEFSLHEEIIDKLLSRQIKVRYSEIIQARKTENTTEENSSHLNDSIKNAGNEILSNTVSLIFPVIIFVLIICFIIWLIKRGIKKANKKSEADDLKKLEVDNLYNSPHNELWNKLGTTLDEKEKNIETFFYNKNGTVFSSVIWSWSKTSFFRILLSRNLVAMEPREREFLGISFLLFNRGLLTENEFVYYRFALINGDGKASIKQFQKNIPYKELYDEIKDAPAAVKFLQDNWNVSVDKAINELLYKLQSLGDNPENKVFTSKIKNRITGGGAWFTDDDVSGSVFDIGGKFQLSLGNLENSSTILQYSGEGSLITIAPPGSGKTQCFVLPNMLTWKGGAVVLDIKGEIYAATHKWREQNVGKVFKFSPLDPKNSNSYNPLVFIRDEADYIWEDSRFLADMMIVPSGASDPFWENMARDVLTAAIAYISFTNEPQDRYLSKVLDIIYGIGWDEMITSLKTNVFVSAMRQTGYALGSIESKQKDSILKSAQSSLSAWQGERISRVTQRSDWSPMDLRNGSPTIYVCINPNEIDSYLSILRVFISQHIRMLTTELPQRGASPVLFMLDELPRLKKMPPIDEALNIGRQYGIKLWMFAQSYGQLKEAYANPDGLIGSCVVRTFMNLPLNDELTTKISDQLGYREGPLDASKQKLVEPLELAGPNFRDTILVFATNTKPVKVRKKFAYEDADLMAKQK